MGQWLRHLLDVASPKATPEAVFKVPWTSTRLQYIRRFLQAVSFRTLQVVCLNPHSIGFKDRSQYVGAEAVFTLSRAAAGWTTWVFLYINNLGPLLSERNIEGSLPLEAPGVRRTLREYIGGEPACQSQFQVVPAYSG